MVKILSFVLLFAGHLSAQEWLESSKGEIETNVDQLPVRIALIDLHKDGSVPPKVMRSPIKQSGLSSYMFSGGASENFDMKLNKRYYKGDDPLPYITSLVPANIFMMRDLGDPKATLFYIRARGCLADRKVLRNAPFSEIQNDPAKLLRSLRTVLGYDGIVVAQRPRTNEFVIAVVEGSNLRAGLQGSALQDSIGDITMRKADQAAQALFSVTDTGQGYALAKSFVGTKLPRVGTKIVFE